MDPGLGELIRTEEGSARAEAIVRRHEGATLPDYVDVVATFGEIATCRLRVDDIIRARKCPGVKSLKAPRYLTFSSPDYSTSSSTEVTDSLRATGAGDGTGVVVAFLDFGFDFVSPNFRLPDGSTRLLCLFDQRKPMRQDVPNPYGYGRFYSREEINRALQQADPYRALSYHPADSDRGNGAHGTHTLDIAAGNGRAPGSIPGIAPASELICIHLATKTSARADLSTSVRLLEGLDVVRKYAGDKPWVANLSLGTIGGDHSGDSVVERAMDALLKEPGRAIVQSTGNYYLARTHSHGRLQPKRRITLDWCVDAADITPNELEVWYSGRDRFRIEVRGPTATAVFSAKLDSDTPITVGDDEVGHIWHRTKEPQTRANHIDCFLYKNAPPGRWQVTLIGENVLDGRFHAWIERDAGRPENQSRFGRDDVTTQYTTGSIANGYMPLVVGAFDARSSDWPIAPFSSSGPTRDGRQKPDLLAPGVAIRAARSTPRGESPGSGATTVMSGTSMAAPWVTGAVARLFGQASRKLSMVETRAIILGNTKLAQDKDPLRSGNGYLDLQTINKGLAELDTSASTVNRHTSIQDTKAMSKQEDKHESTTWKEPSDSQIIQFPSEAHMDGSLGEESEKKRNFILISGGPGPFDNRDVQHDVAWSNYVDPPLLLTRNETLKAKFADKDEQVWWFVYKPAYERRWQEDKASSDANRRQAVKNVKDEGFNSYTALLEDRANDRGWTLKWLEKSDDLWSKLNTFNDPISRVWYWGHAKNNLWLSLDHRSNGTPISPGADAVIKHAAISSHSGLKSKFQAGAFDRVHRFIGCNTEKFAKAWAKTFGVWTEGVKGYVHFCAVHPTGGDTCLFKSGSGHAKIKFYSTNGTYDSSKDSRAKTPKCDTPKDLCKQGDAGETIMEEQPEIAAEQHAETQHFRYPAKFGAHQDTQEQTQKGRNFILISGGPGPYNTGDPEHDESWANYVTPPLLMTDTAKKLKAFADADEDVWWFVYKPAHERRWQEDSASTNVRRKKAVKDVKNQGFKSYVDLIEARAQGRGWHLRWLLKADDLWAKLKTFNDPISRVWYWGHAHDDLWLSLRHYPSGRPRRPRADAIIDRTSVPTNAALKKKFQPGSFNRVHRFIGCNTDSFAQIWAKTFGVWAEGVDNYVHFCAIHQTGGETCLLKRFGVNAKIKYYSPSGNYDASKGSRATTPSCHTPKQLCGAPRRRRRTGTSGQRAPIRRRATDFETEWAETHDETIAGDGPELVELADTLLGSGAADTLTGTLSSAVDDQIANTVSEEFPEWLSETLAGTELIETEKRSPVAVIARAGEAIPESLEAGDVLIRRLPGGTSHYALLADGHVVQHDELAASGLKPESHTAGRYTQVIDGGAFPHRVSEGFARRLTDVNGLLADDQMIVRLPTESVHEAATQMHELPLGESTENRILDEIRRELELNLRSDDKQELHARRKRLRELFRAVPRTSAMPVYKRLAFRRRHDRLTAMFHGKLSTATRDEMLCILLSRKFRLPKGVQLRGASGHRGVTTKQACFVISIAFWLSGRLRRLERQNVITTEDQKKLSEWAEFLTKEATRLGRFQPATPAQIKQLRADGQQLIADAKKLLKFPSFLRRQSIKSTSTRGHKLIGRFRIWPKTIRIHEHESARISFVLGPNIRSVGAIIMEEEDKEGTVFREFVWRDPKTRYQSAIWDGTFRVRRNKPPKTGTYRVRLFVSDHDGNTEEVTSNIRVLNPHNITVLPRTNSSLAPKAMYFDGKHATLVDERGNKIRARAVSGMKPNNPRNKRRMDFTKPQYQHLKNRGPIPEGTYWIRAGEVEDPDIRSGRLKYASGALENAWGPRRIPLHPRTVGERGGFYIHLDKTNDGTAGGIGIHPVDEGKFNQMTAVIDFGLKKNHTKLPAKIPVIVDYSGKQTESWELSTDTKMPAVEIFDSASESEERSAEDIEPDIVETGEYLPAAKQESDVAVPMESSTELASIPNYASPLAEQSSAVLEKVIKIAERRVFTRKIRGVFVIGRLAGFVVFRVAKNDQNSVQLATRFYGKDRTEAEINVSNLIFGADASITATKGQGGADEFGFRLGKYGYSIEFTTNPLSPITVEAPILSIRGAAIEKLFPSLGIKGSVDLQLQLWFDLIPDYRLVSQAIRAGGKSARYFARTVARRFSEAAVRVSGRASKVLALGREVWGKIVNYGLNFIGKEIAKQWARDLKALGSAATMKGAAVRAFMKWAGRVLTLGSIILDNYLNQEKRLNDVLRTYFRRSEKAIMGAFRDAFIKEFLLLIAVDWRTTLDRHLVNRIPKQERFAKPFPSQHINDLKLRKGTPASNAVHRWFRGSGLAGFEWSASLSRFDWQTALNNALLAHYFARLYAMDRKFSHAMAKKEAETAGMAAAFQYVWGFVMANTTLKAMGVPVSPLGQWGEVAKIHRSLLRDNKEKTLQAYRDGIQLDDIDIFPF